MEVGAEVAGSGDALGRVAMLPYGHDAAVAVATAAGDRPLVGSMRLSDIHTHELRPALQLLRCHQNKKMAPSELSPLILCS